RMRHAPTGRSAAKVQCEVLSCGDALHSLRSRDRVHVPVGGGLQRVDQAERSHLLEHAQLYLDLDDRLRLRGQKRRARLEEIKRFADVIRRLHHLQRNSRPSERPPMPDKRMAQSARKSSYQTMTKALQKRFLDTRAKNTK